MKRKCLVLMPRGRQCAQPPIAQVISVVQRADTHEVVVLKRGPYCAKHAKREAITRGFGDAIVAAED